MQSNLVEVVKAYALRHYNAGGWDVIVECYSNDEIAKLIAGSSSGLQAIRKAKALVDIFAERQADARYHRHA